MRARNAGFTLMELLITTVIVAILAAVAIPSYRGYTIRANRTDGKTAVLAMAGALERCYTRFNAYNAADCTVDITDVPTQSQHYLVSAEVTASTFEVTAVPQGPQVQDTDCGTLGMNQLNERSKTGSATVRECWDR